MERDVAISPEMQRTLAEGIRQFRLPRYEDIPDVGLFLDQATQYVNTYIEKLGLQPLTGSMISNYVKHGYIPGPKKKRYYAEQLAYLLFVGMAKNVMSMDDIGLFVNIQCKSYATDVAYDYFCNQLSCAIAYTFGLSESMEDSGVTHTDEKVMLRISVLSIASVIYMTQSFSLIKKHMAQTEAEAAAVAARQS